MCVLCVCNRKSTAYDKTKNAVKTIVFFFPLFRSIRSSLRFRLSFSPDRCLRSISSFLFYSVAVFFFWLSCMIRTLFVKKSIIMKILKVSEKERFTVLPPLNCMQQHCDYCLLLWSISFSFLDDAYRNQLHANCHHFFPFNFHWNDEFLSSTSKRRETEKKSHLANTIYVQTWELLCPSNAIKLTSSIGIESRIFRKSNERIEARIRRRRKNGMPVFWVPLSIPRNCHIRHLIKLKFWRRENKPQFKTTTNLNQKKTFRNK